MELNKNVLPVVKVAVLLFLMGFSATAEAGRFDPSFIISQVLNNGDDAASGYLIPKASTKDCCDTCVCDVPYPDIWCRCKDDAESCHPSCPADACKCTKSDPPQCQCWKYAKGKCYIPVCG